MQALSKKNDQDTSYEAAENYDKTGKRNHHFSLILIAMSGLSPFTSAEIAAWSELDRWQVARRLPEMARAGLVARDGKKTCSVLKSNCVAWKLTAKGAGYGESR